MHVYIVQIIEGLISYGVQQGGERSEPPCLYYINLLLQKMLSLILSKFCYVHPSNVEDFVQLGHPELQDNIIIKSI